MNSMNLEMEEIRDKFRSLTEENENLTTTVSRLKEEVDLLSTALRRVIDLLPESKKDEIVKFLVVQGGRR